MGKVQKVCEFTHTTSSNPTESAILVSNNFQCGVRSVSGHDAASAAKFIYSRARRMRVYGGLKKIGEEQQNSPYIEHGPSQTQWRRDLPACRCLSLNEEDCTALIFITTAAGRSGDASLNCATHANITWSADPQVQGSMFVSMISNGLFQEEGMSFESPSANLNSPSAGWREVEMPTG